MTKMNVERFYEYLIIHTEKGENKLFFVMNPEDIAYILTNAAYKLENNIELTDLEERLRNEIGYLGRCFVKEYCNSLEEWKKLESIPYPLHANLTIQQLTEALQKYNNQQKESSVLAIIPE